MPPDSSPPIPLLVLTGFLGSGKTTVLSRLLERPGGRRLAVLVNDLGELALDPLLLSEVDVEAVDEEVLALLSGCACCALRGEVHEALERMLQRRPTAIVLETTGVADPAPIVHGLATDPRLMRRVRPAGVVAVVDALRAQELVRDQPEARRQLELADRVVVTKADLAPGRVGPVRELLEAAAPGCEVRVAEHGRVDPAWLLDAPRLARLRDVADADAWLHHGGEPADGVERVTAHTFASPDPADLSALALWLELVTQLDGRRLLRVKLVARCRDSGDVFALQSAGRSVSPPRRLERPPSGWIGTRAVLVERGLEPPATALLLTSLEEAAAGTRSERSGASRG